MNDRCLARSGLRKQKCPKTTAAAVIIVPCIQPTRTGGRDSPQARRPIRVGSIFPNNRYRCCLPGEPRGPARIRAAAENADRSPGPCSWVCSRSGEGACAIVRRDAHVVGFGHRGDLRLHDSSGVPDIRLNDIRHRLANIPAYVSPGPHNPMGARALYLYQGDQDTLYRIHGTNQPEYIGRAISRVASA